MRTLQTIKRLLQAEILNRSSALIDLTHSEQSPEAISDCIDDLRRLKQASDSVHEVDEYE